MVIIATVVVAAWAILLGAAYLARVILGLGRTTAALIVLGTYAGLGTAALVWLGFGLQGYLAAFGLSLPCTVAIALVLTHRPSRQ